MIGSSGFANRMSHYESVESALGVQQTKTRKFLSYLLAPIDSTLPIGNWYNSLSFLLGN